MNIKVDLFKTLVKQVKYEKLAMVCERIRKDRSLKLFWRMHKSINGVVNTICVRDFRSSDLSWKKTDDDKGNALLSHYLEQSSQKDKMRRISVSQFTLTTSMPATLSSQALFCDIKKIKRKSTLIINGFVQCLDTFPLKISGFFYIHIIIAQICTQKPTRCKFASSVMKGVKLLFLEAFDYNSVVV
jgi:hypothetical protein